MEHEPFIVTVIFGWNYFWVGMKLRYHTQAEPSRPVTLAPTADTHTTIDCIHIRH